MRDAPADNVLNPTLAAKLHLLRRVPVFIHEENVGTDVLEIIHKIHNPAAAVDGALLHTAQRFQEILPFLFGVDRISSLEIPHRLIRSDPDKQISMARRFLEECDVTGMKQIETSSDQHSFLLCVQLNAPFLPLQR